MKFNKVYIPRDAIERHEDFEMWYEDGSVFSTVHSEGDWQQESDKVSFDNRFGAHMAQIRPDPNTLAYFLRVERYEYTFHTYILFEEYFVEGCLWEVYGSLTKPPVNYWHTDDKNNAVHIRLTNFKNKGECFEVKVRDVSYLRIAAVSAVAMMIKEYYKGRSEGIIEENVSIMQKAKRLFKSGKGITWEEIQAGKRYV